MSDVFDIKRFFRYLGRDIRLARGNYLLGLLICACMPVIAYLFHVLGSLLFTGSVDSFPMAVKYVCIAVSTFVVIVTFPSKQYGRLTDKRYGSDYLMLPASTLEKFLSCLVISCLVVPFVLYLVMFGLDSFMSLLAPGYGDAMLPGIVDFFGRVSEGIGDVVSVNVGLMCGLNWCESILCFVLGAVVFKKSKVAKTILALIGIAMLFSSASVGLFRYLDFSGIEFGSLDEFVDWLDRKDFNTVVNSFIFVQFLIKFAVLDICIFLRLKTLKH